MKKVILGLMIWFMFCFGAMANGKHHEDGAKGDTGATGEQGPIGLTGPKGDTGAQGPKGDTGLNGTNGTNGIGIDGTNGTNGANIYSQSMAMAGAVAHAATCDWSSSRPQGNLGLANHKGKTAISLGACKKYKEVVGSISITKQDGDSDEMLSIGAHWRF